MHSFSKFAAIALATVTLGAATVYGQTAAQPAQPNCGVETWSTDKMMYVTTPCAHGTTYENPSAKPSENFNTK